MNCQRFEDVVNDITREQIIHAGLRSEALKHSEHCERCGERLEDERAMTLRLRSLAENMESAGAPERIAAHLLAAFDEFALAQFPAPNKSVRQYRRQYLIGAIAAGLLIVFGLFAIRWALPVRPTTGTPLVVRTGSPASTGITTTSAPPLVLQRPTKRPAIAGRKFSSRHQDGASARPQPANTANAEIATDFLPLTYGAATNLEEGGRMVRVELPHSAMATFGLPVNIERANEKVKADVLLGVDGLAHAIRFVR
jgi:hypothetical protein